MAATQSVQTIPSQMVRVFCQNGIVAKIIENDRGQLRHRRRRLFPISTLAHHAQPKYFHNNIAVHCAAANDFQRTRNRYK